MSQEKVTRYKEEKANRKEAIKKEKRIKMIRKCIYSVVGVVLLGWIGISAYGKYEDLKPRESVEVDYKAVDEYIESLSAEETSEAETTETETTETNVTE